mmetsp:Transcript_27363/g.109580  ORF Transcript_27363/g.109580 Transcript_27363/m.109580 type:complete len:270 (+) Transcript_27363:605-1414(+)
MYSSKLSLVTVALAPSGLSSTVVAVPQWSSVTVKSRQQTSTSSRSLSLTRLEYVSASSCSRSAIMSGQPRMCLYSGRTRCPATIWRSKSALPSRRPVKWKYRRCSSLAMPDDGLTCMHIWLIDEYDHSAKSGLKTVSDTSWNHSRATPPASTPGSPMNSKRKIFFMSDSAIDSIASIESSSRFSRRTLILMCPSSQGTWSLAICCRNQASFWWNGIAAYRESSCASEVPLLIAGTTVVSDDFSARTSSTEYCGFSLDPVASVVFLSSRT